MSSIMSSCQFIDEQRENRSFDDEIVISGFSGRLPESSTIEEFRNNLFNGVDMVNDDPRRWPTGFNNLPSRMGKMKQEDLENFDITYFGIHQKQAEKMDPTSRVVLEATHEAIIDSGYNPEELRGSCTGVYIGAGWSDVEEYWYSDQDLLDGYALTGSTRTMIPNRISFSFDFHGPSYAIDTGCSSSFSALAQAFGDIRSGRCDAAIVGGVNNVLRPNVSIEFNNLKMLSPDGACKAFDQSGNGYVRSDACVVLFLQKAKNARRIYSTILNARTNTDGAKDMGITYPNGEMQKRLIEKTFMDINLNPHDVVYVEAHGTGTQVGDPQEVNAICDFFCKDRKIPLLIGSVKSNMGHSEPASGLCSIAKMLIAMEEGVIPGNLHYNSPNPNIKGLLDGYLKVVDKNTPWGGGIVALNNFGFGGANGHVIMESYSKPRSVVNPDKPSRLVLVSGRTEEAVETLLKDIETHSDDEEYLALINEIHTKNISRHNFRGYIVLGQDEPVHEVIELSGTKRPIWFVYSGMGSQWSHMVKDLMQIGIFNKSIYRCAEVLRPEKINLIDILKNFKEFDILDSFVAIAAMQIALTDLLTHLGIIPDGIVGHSVGEVVCAYADGCFTLEQTILAAYWRGRSIVDTQLIPGMMAAVGLSWEECLKRLPDDIFPACNNSADNVTISGPRDSVNKFVENLNDEGIFAKTVNVSGRAFHSKYILDAGPKLKKSLDVIIPNPKNRSDKWISSSVPEDKWDTPLAKDNSADYHVNNLLSPVFFHEAIQHIPDNAICVEVAPHGILQAILKRSLGKNVTNLSLIKRNHESNFQYLLSNIGKFYGAGGQPNVTKLFREVSFPVGRGTPMLNSKVKWDHSQKYIVPYYGASSTSRQSIVSFNLSNEEDSFLGGHIIDGRVIFPATGYIVLAWRQFAKNLGSTYDRLPVIFENLVFHCATFMASDGSIKFGITFFDVSGKFQICEGGTLVMSGTIRIAENIDREELSLDPVQESIGLPLESNDVYKEFRLRGYDFADSFRRVIQSDALRTTGKLEWSDKNWVCFIDAMLQLKLLGKEERALYLPTRIEKLIINPEKHFKLAVEMGTEKNSIFSGYVYKDIGIIKSGGVEIHGITDTLAPLRQNSQAPPKLERYTFVPNYNDNNLSEHSDLATEYAIMCAVHLIIENSKGAIKIKTAEFLLNRAPKSTLSKNIKQIIDSDPKLGSDTTIVASESTPELEQYENDTQMRIIYEDITKRSLQPGYHLCIAANVLSHPDVEVILKNLKYSIGDEGFILLEEDITENDKRDIEIFKKLNLVIVSSQICNKKEFLLLRHEFDIETQNIQIVSVTEKNFNWLDSLKLAIRTAESENKLVYIVCQGEEQFGAVGFMNCLKHETGGYYARLFFIQNTNAPEFSLSNLVYKDQIAKNLIINVLKNGVWGTFRHFLLENQQNSMNTIKQVENACVNVLTKGDLSSLRWIEGPPAQDNPNLNDPGFELYTVYCASLNFRDIMLSTGKISADTLVEKVAQQECVLGVEFSGRDLEGNRVMAIVSSLSLATTVAARNELVWRVPDFWTLEQASSIPMAYATAYYALVVRGKMKKGETILIHAGSGGVGQAAIRIALSAGLTVYTTVGSKEKREFLKDTFPQLTDRHIGNSRDCSFKQMIMHETKGKGVDLVLNSLADEKLQESVKCLGRNGRFLEIGKFDISNNSSLGMFILRKNTSFHGIFIDHVMNSDDEELHQISQLLKDGISKGVVQPLPTTVFEKQQLEEAFRFMATSKHIGKVVIKVREEEEQKQIIPTKKLISAIPRTYFPKEKTYVVVGGLGGFGLELIQWLVLRGARKIVATSRKGIKTGYQYLMVRRWQEKGVNVVVDNTNDITTQEGAQGLLIEAEKLGPIGGIFHLAVVLRDDFFQNQEKADFHTVCLPKINGTKNLDAASRILCPDLDYFICFSSVSCGRGNPGQSNYGLANSTMERICEARQKAGYPATAIQWGAIGDTGIFIEKVGDNNTILGGFLPQRMVSCLQTMDLFMQQPYPILASMVVADKGTRDIAGKISLEVCIANILGFKDLKKISDTAALSELGMDSLMGTEIRQILQRNYDMTMNELEIRQLTFKKIKSFETEVENLTKKQQVNADLKNAGMIQFPPELMPKDVLVRLPSNCRETCKKPPLFVVHPIEGITDILMPLAAELNYQVWGIQCTADVPLQSIQQIAKFYIKKIKTIQSTGPYRLIGYSFGAAVVYEMTRQLENELNDVNNVIMLDGSPQWVRNRTSSQLKARSQNYDETAILVYFVAMVANISSPIVIQELESFSTYNEKLKRCTEMIHEVTKLRHELISVAANAYVKRVLAGAAYQPTGYIKADVTLIKCSVNAVKYAEDYGLNKICEKKVKINVVEGDHCSFLNGDSLKEVVKIVKNTIN